MPIIQGARVALAGAQIVNRQLGYDFIGLTTRLLVFFAVAFLIQIFVKGKVAIDHHEDHSKHGV